MEDAIATNAICIDYDYSVWPPQRPSSQRWWHGWAWLTREQRKLAQEDAVIERLAADGAVDVRVAEDTEATEQEIRLIKAKGRKEEEQIIK